VLATKEELKKFAREEMCGRCLPCPAGVLTAISLLERLSQGEGTERDLERLFAIGEYLPQLARCPRGQRAGEQLAQSLKEEEAFRAHLARRCPAGDCQGLVKYRVIPERCTMCGRCREVCPQDAILGEPYVAYRGDNRPYEIVPKLCDGCGLCQEACPEEAIERL
jgi:NADH-quinone oxidoreductase subunit F